MLRRALKKSEESEKRLLEKCQEMSTETCNTINSIASMTQLLAKNRVVIAQLKHALWKTKDAAEASRTTEKSLIKKVKKLRSNINTLCSPVERDIISSTERKCHLREVIGARHQLKKEINTHDMLVQQARLEIGEINQHSRAVEAEKVFLDAAVIDLHVQIDARRAESAKEKERKERLEYRLQKLRASVDFMKVEIQARTTHLSAGVGEIGNLKSKSGQQNPPSDHAIIRVLGDELTRQVASLQRELNGSRAQNNKIGINSTSQKVELQRKLGEIDFIRLESLRTQQMRDRLLRRIEVLKSQRLEVEEYRRQLKRELSELECEAETQQHVQETKRRIIHDLVHGYDVLKVNLPKEAKSAQLLHELLAINGNIKHNFEGEVSGYQAKIQAQRRAMNMLQAERNQYVAEAQKTQACYLEALEESKARQLTVMQLQNKIAQGQGNIKQQGNEYEAVRSDRNLYSRHLVESQEEIAEIKSKFKTTRHQIEQLKEEIQIKDQALSKEQFEHMTVEQEKQLLKTRFVMVQKALLRTENEQANGKSKANELNQTIMKAEADKLKQHKEYAMVVNERDMLGAQLIKRSDELTNLYEKLKIQQSTLNHGKRVYSKRAASFGVVKRDALALGSELQIMRASAANSNLLKHETAKLQGDLLQERAKVRALSEELESRMNVHRWRRLGGSDPDMYDMVKRMHRLQKQLLEYLKHITGKDRRIQEKKRLCVHLKAIILRPPDSELVGQLTTYQGHLNRKRKQLKAILAELDLHRSEVFFLKLEAETLGAQQAQFKKHFCLKFHFERGQRNLTIVEMERYNDCGIFEDGKHFEDSVSAAPTSQWFG